MGAKEKDGPQLLFGMGAAPRVCPSQQWSPFLGLVTGRCPHVCFIYGSDSVAGQLRLLLPPLGQDSHRQVSGGPRPWPQPAVGAPMAARHTHAAPHAGSSP